MLPITEVPSVNMTLPVSKKSIRVRAMTTKEERILLMLKAGGEKDDIESGINELIKACTYSEIDYSSLQLPDIVAVFLKIVEISQGSVITHEYVCNQLVTDTNNKTTKCGTTISVDVDLRDVVFSGTSNTEGLVYLTNDIIVKMKYMTPEIYKQASIDSTDESDMVFRSYAYCIEYCMKGDTVFSEFSNDEIYEWFMNLPKSDAIKVAEFLNDMPKAELSYTIKCPKCGYTEKITLKSLTDFFMSDIPD